MTPTDKGRFCASCQKQVFDFTNSTDREIATALKNGAACGRFKESQLDRDLIIPKEKNTMWIAASAAVVSFFTLRSEAVKAQEPQTETVPSAINVESDTISESLKVIYGNVMDETGIKVGGANINNLTTGRKVVTDVDGNFIMRCCENDSLQMQFPGFKNQNFIVGKSNRYDFTLQLTDTSEYVEMVGAVRRVSFFKRTWFRITRIFR